MSRVLKKKKKYLSITFQLCVDQTSQSAMHLHDGAFQSTNNCRRDCDKKSNMQTNSFDPALGI